MISPFLYESIYRKYRPIVFSYISQRVASREDAEDLCQDVFVKLSRALKTYDEDKAAVSTLVYRIAHNAVIDYYRTSRTHEEVSEEAAVLPSAEDTVMDRAQARELAEALAKLPEQQRDILILRFYRGWTLVRIAKEMGLTYNTVVGRQKRALEKLREMLADHRS